GISLDGRRESELMRIGLFYGSSTCYTEIAAEKIRDCMAESGVEVELFKVGQDSLSAMRTYEHLILGIPTWDYGELQEDWEAAWPALAELDFSGKQLAIYGCGDQLGYPEWFQDAMGYLHNKVQEQGARLCGYWPADDYDFTS